MNVYKITGKIVNSDSKEGIKGLRVEAWDKDLLMNDMVGSAITGDGGVFRIQFDESYFKELFLDRNPDLFFKVYKGTKLIKSTEDSVLWNVDREDIEMTIELKDYQDTTKPEVTRNKNVSTRSMLQATYTPRKPRAGEEPYKAPRALEKAAFFAKLAPTPEELERIANKYENSLKNKKAIKKAGGDKNILSRIKTISNAVPNDGKLIVLPDVKMFADMDVEVLVSIARDLIQDREDRQSSREIERLNNLLNAFRRNMSVEPVGYLHLERLSFTPVGIERGELVHSVPLSPGEEVNIKHREWSHITEEFERIVTDYLEEFSEEGVTEKTELAQTVDSQAQHSSAFNTGVTASGSYGPISITTTVGYNASESSSKSRQLTRNQSADITRKASSRAKKEYKISFRVASAAETEDESVQRIKNPFSDRATRVDYYQLIRKWQVDLFRYGMRMTWDLIIPEPGYGLIAKILKINELKEKLNQSFDIEKELGISMAQLSLDPEESDTNKKYFGDICTEHGITLSETPPTLSRTYTIDYYKDCVHDGPFSMTDCNTGDTSTGWYSNELIKERKIYELPEGYMVSDSVNIRCTDSWRTAGGDCDRYLLDLKDVPRGRLWMIRGGGEEKEKPEGSHIDPDPQHVPVDGYGQWAFCPEDPGYIGFRNYDKWKKEKRSGFIKLDITIWNIAFAGFNMNIPLRLKPEAEYTWKLKVWGEIEKNLRYRFEEERQKIKQQLSYIEEELGAQDALSLRKKEREEVMKGVLEAFGLSPSEENNRDPRIIRFIHHALEWENMLYFLYPYFWADPNKEIGNKVDEEHPYWEFKKYLDHPDPMHRAFLKAGAARVVLPVRPGFEEAFLAFVNGSDIGDLPPAPYLEIGKEFESHAKTNYPGILAANPVENYRPLLSRKQQQTWDRMQLMMRLLEVYRRVNGRYPPTEEGLEVLRDYFPFKDPWGNEYVYTCPGQHGDFDLISYGADGQPGGSNINADIPNWDPAFPKEYPEQVQAARDIELISLLLEEYRKVHGQYPTSVEGLSQLKELIPLKDSWGNDFDYKCPGNHLDYDLVSHGANGEPGGEGEDADITNWAEASLIGQWFEYTPTSALDIAFDEEMPNA